ncbi:hypothetical protein C7293_09780 [filamentous cyanobacterium CCT1]|nr:hypothetical protein C7293_09780 [filamentous cyanobacterium CCT1]PSN78590.1 hypothetical protein C8B47_16065 [filamentous cyanobacterium CCP4]
MPSVIGAIRDKWLALGGESSFLGQPETDELTTPDGVGRFNHFQGGSIYWTPSTGAHEVHGAIRDKWAELGWERSWLGYPITDEIEFPEGGRVSSFQHGTIYWWPDTGAIELNDVVVHYTGIVCFGESNELSSSDEPYVVMGLNSPTGAWAIRSRVYGGVDAGESRPDLIEIYRGKPNGLAISVLLMENDEGNPDKYKEAMQAAVGAAFTGVTALVAIIPVVGAVIAAVVGPLLAAVTPIVGTELNRLLGTGDDRIGYETLPITPKQMVVLAARTGNSEEKGIGFKLVTRLLSGDGASYKVYFGLVPA